MRKSLLEIFQEAYCELRPRAAMPEFAVSFFPFANLNNTVRLRNGRVVARISDLLEGAPVPVQYAIAHILLATLYRKPIANVHAVRYRRHTGSRALSLKTDLIRQMRGRKRLLGPAGRFFDLNQIFDELNQRFFYGLLARPQMTWSSSDSRANLGHYDPAHNAIVVSRIFDQRGMPRYAVEYLVYHEMLHLKHPVRLRGSRRCVHPAAFQAEEKLFPRLEDAKKLLRRL